MKGMLWNCEFLKCETSDDANLFEECLLLFVCLENGDTRNTIREGLRRVVQLNHKRFNRSTLVLFPFAHLSHDIMPLEQAEQLYGEIIKKFEADFPQVFPMAFNKSKRITIKLLPENEDVSFIEY